MTPPIANQHGAHLLPVGGVRFSLWAPRPHTVALRLVSGPGSGGSDLPMEPGPGGTRQTTVRAAGPGTRYLYILDGERARPDPRARFLPDGVHGPAEVIDPTFAWKPSRDASGHRQRLSQ